MPGVDIETVALDENTDHPLDAVLAQLDRGKTGPVMIVGLERSVPSDASEHPVLDALNLSRPDWVSELPRPLVFWVPDYLLGLIGREAPDFLDWRSDTLFFPEVPGEELVSLDSNIWLGEMNRLMPEAQRRSRIEELKSRLTHGCNYEDQVILAARADWLVELGRHLYSLDEWSAARESYLEAFGIEQELGRQDKIAGLIGNIAALDVSAGELERAEDGYRRALAIQENSKDRRGQIFTLGGLTELKLRAGLFEVAEELCLKALELANDSDNGDALSYLYTLLVKIKLNQHDLRAAREAAEKALATTQETASGLRNSNLMSTLGVLLFLEGDFARARQLMEEAESIARLLGDRTGLAGSLFLLGVILFQNEQLAEAESTVRQARELYEQVKNEAGKRRADEFLRQLSPPAS
jgi:tetratricopeptide (TPR) repeat protein